MLFLNSRPLNGTTASSSMNERSYTQKMGHSFIVCGCLSIIVGLILIVLGVISEMKKTTFIGVGIISLGIGFFLMTLVCLYGKLDICYNNWVYRSRVRPTNPRTLQTTAGGPVEIRHSPRQIQQRSSFLPECSPAPVTIISDMDINKISPSSLPPIQAIKIF